MCLLSIRFVLFEGSGEGNSKLNYSIINIFFILFYVIFFFGMFQKEYYFTQNNLTIKFSLYPDSQLHTNIQQ